MFGENRRGNRENAVESIDKLASLAKEKTFYTFNTLFWVSFSMRKEREIHTFENNHPSEVPRSALGWTLGFLCLHPVS